MSFLLGITIGPVQSYIEESRKLRDLCNSSKIISDIMKYIHTYISNNVVNAEVIYPNHEQVQKVDCSNYMIFEIDKLIKLENLESQIFESIYCDVDKDFNNGIVFNYENTIKESFHLFWVIEEIADKEYSKVYEKTTKLISDLKNSYEFDQVEQKSEKKCLICGKRNIVTNKLKNTIRRKYMLNSDEDLCEACLFKRIYKNDKFPNMPSLYSVAIKNWKIRYKDSIGTLSDNLNKIFNEIDKYYNPNEINKILNVIEASKKSKKNLDKNLRKIQDDLTQDDLTKNEEKIRNVKNIMKDIYMKEDEKEGIEQPNYEYSFIQFDIDNLGCWMSGKYLEDKSDLKDYQKKMSNVLVKFSQKLRENLEKKCNIIYSGGDDFLSILPSENIIEVLEIIDKEFKCEVEDKLKKYISYDRKITYSTSVTIAQCKEPMSYALSKTRLELENVKEKYKNSRIEKNGVAINYIINNGKEITCYLKRDDLEEYFKIIKNYKEIESNLAFSFINNFENEFIGFNCNDISFEEAGRFNEITKNEFKRLVLRSKMKKDNEDKLKEYLQDLVKFFQDMMSKNSNEVQTNHLIIDFKNVMNIFKIYQKLCIDNLRLMRYRKGE